MFVRREKFDFFFSIGAACSCTVALRESRLQRGSLPFDWVMGTPLPERVEMVCSGFAGFLSPDLLEDTGLRNQLDHRPCCIYRNRETGMVFNHEFTLGSELAASYPAVKEKYDRRIARLYASIAASRRVLAVYIESPDNRTMDLSADVLLAARARLAARFPETEISLLCLRCFPGVSFEARAEERPGPLVSCAAFDYSSKVECDGPWSVDTGLLRRFFRGYVLRRSLRRRISDFFADRRRRRARRRK